MDKMTAAKELALTLDVEAGPQETRPRGVKRETLYALARLAAFILVGLCCGVAVGLILASGKIGRAHV